VSDLSVTIDGMFEVDAELAAMLAWDDAVRAELPELSEPEPWLDEGEPLQSVPTAELLTDCLTSEPGVQALMTLSRLDPSTLTAGERIDLLVGLERHRAWLDGLQQRTLAAIDRADGSKEHRCQEAVMCALRVSANAAQTRLKTARTLTDDLPRTLGLLSSGVISVRQAELIADASWKLEADVTTEFESLVLDRACEQSLPELRRAVKRAAVRVDPATAEQRHARAREDRCVRKTALEDGMAELRLISTADNIETAWLRLDAGVRLLPAQDPRTRDQQRADLLVDAILTGIPHDALPGVAGPATQHPGGGGRRHAAQPRRPTRRPRRPRRDHRPHRPTARRGERRHLAPATDRPEHRPPTRLRPHHLPATPGTRRLRARPRLRLLLPVLQPARLPLRRRPRPPLGRGW
jgi:hypothetical protein